MASWVFVIADAGGHLRQTRDEELAWNLGRRPGANVLAIPVIDQPIEPDPLPPVDIDREELGRQLDEPRRLIW